MQACLESAMSGSGSHLKLDLQRWQLLLDVCQLGRHGALLALQVVDLALSSLSPLKELAALLLHTCHPSPSTMHTHSPVCHREAQSCSQSKTLHFASQHIMCCVSTAANQCWEVDISTPRYLSSRNRYRRNASNRSNMLNIIVNTVLGIDLPVWWRW